MWSASRPWPHASWKRMPPLPPASTTGSSPEGAGRADSLDSARLAARRASSSTDTSSNSSNPSVRAAVSKPVCSPVSPTATHETENRVRACSSRARRPSELAISTWRREAPHPASPCERASPDARAASSARCNRASVSAFDPDDGAGRPVPCPPGAVAPRGPTATVRVPPPPLLGQVGSVGEAGGLPGNHPDAGPPLPPRRELLHPSVVEQGGRGRPVLGEHLGELTTVPEGFGQYPFEYR